MAQRRLRTTKRCLQACFLTSKELQAAGCCDLAGNFLEREVIGPNVLRKSWMLELLEVGLEPLDCEGLPGQSVDAQPRREPAETAVVETLEHSFRPREQRNVVHVVVPVPKPAQDLLEVLLVHKGLRGNHEALMLTEDPVERVDDADPPRGQVLKVPPQMAGQHSMQPEAHQLRVRDPGAWVSMRDLRRNVRLAAAERSVDPEQHIWSLAERADYLSERIWGAAASKAVPWSSRPRRVAPMWERANARFCRDAVAGATRTSRAARGQDDVCR